MRSLFARIRWRLVGWTMLIVGIILLLLGGVVYFSLQRSLLEQVDRNLAQRAEALIPPLLQPDRRFQGAEGFRGGVFYVAFGPDGRVMGNPQQVDIEAAAALPTPETRMLEFDTMEINGEPARVAIRRMPDGGKLVVGQTLQPELAALQSLLLVLAAGGVIGLLLSLAGAWFLAGRALIPIQQAFRRQQEFVADASHELRTPLTVLQSSTELLNQHRAEPLAANAELFDDVRDEIARMVRLTTDLLTLARTDSGELELMVAPIDVAELATDVTRLTLPLAQARGVELSANTHGSSPVVDADPDRLQQVLLILLDNAIKHTPAGGHVDVEVRQHSGYAMLDVVDSGEGIAPEHLERIFDRFYRADKARSRAHGGTGLGLAIARMLVDAHDGSIEVTSTPGVGTRVSVRLPLEGHSRSLGRRFGELTTRLAQ
jgi:two-component system, OmpR family, sensor histidine kinase CiaH